MSHAEIWGTGRRCTWAEWRVECGDVCIWTRVGRDPVFSIWPILQHISLGLLRALSPPATGQPSLLLAPKTRQHAEQMWEISCGWNNTRHVNTRHVEKKKKKTRSDHVLRSMPSSRLTGWRGQPERKSDWGTESTWLLLLTLILYKQNAKFLLDWNDLAWLQRFEDGAPFIHVRKAHWAHVTKMSLRLSQWKLWTVALALNLHNMRQGLHPLEIQVIGDGNKSAKKNPLLLHRVNYPKEKPPVAKDSVMFHWLGHFFTL